MSMRQWMVAGAMGLYLATIIGANYLTSRYGLVAVGFGLSATAGTWLAGLSFSARDLVQSWAGRPAVLLLIVAGAVVSWFVSPVFAVASGVAFLLSEGVDMAIYTPLRARHPYWAVAASNTVGSAVDAWLFLWLAFGSIAYWEGNVVGKLWTILPALAVLGVVRAVSQRVHQPASA